jgi:hypothetical protein
LSSWVKSDWLFVFEKSVETKRIKISKYFILSLP